MSNNQTSSVVDIRVAIAGLGAIGQSLARSLAAGKVPGVKLVAVSAKNHEKAAAFVKTLTHSVPVLKIEELEPVADLVVECAPAALLSDIVTPFLKAGKQAIVLSVGALLFNDHLRKVAAEHGGTIMVPTGALIGLDAVIAAAEGHIHEVKMVTRKPPAGLKGAPHLLENNISVDGLTKPLKVFEGNARDAAKGFPANLNVVVALALAGVGPERTTLEIWADPTVTRNTHTINVDSDSARFTMTIENIPSENPKTGRIVAQSVVAMLRKMRAGLRVGT
ncbi:MAG: aspartate dehydrogenase [Burkholderiaceae bacterium]|nr:aspartate dehydrogenase [Burkholderiaceae bacterium]MCD8516939.1 aspartate dehydrogenase [Burkholderiaceae bacterium]MCD8536773.1 aspartate dehydrogenase [Burkholderiaceae bacterium]MCD8565647.1 aspartate dehydrogenase [Burkholderiaceae bacterium]